MNKNAIKTNTKTLKKDLKLLNGENYLYASNDQNLKLIIDVAEIPFLGGIKMTLSECYKLYFDVDSILHPEVIVPADMLAYYVEKFLKAKNETEVYCVNLLARHQFKEGYKIEFPPDKAGRVKIGVISGDFKQYIGIHYRLLKKDGTLGKKEFLLYGGIDYKLLDREFINYEKL